MVLDPSGVRFDVCVVASVLVTDLNCLAQAGNFGEALDSRAKLRARTWLAKSGQEPRLADLLAAMKQDGKELGKVDADSLWITGRPLACS